MVVFNNGFPASCWMVTIEIWRDTKIGKKLSLRSDGAIIPCAGFFEIFSVKK
jgi:hypothetical protein